MEKTDIILDDHPERSIVEFLDDRINEFNFDQTDIRDGRQLAVYIRDTTASAAGPATLVAGLYGWTWGSTCVISLLWVREDLRGRGLGDRLLAIAEAEAQARGCRQITLSTHSFQAPAFYQARGYRIVGTIDDYPVGHQSHTLVKFIEQK